MADRLLPRRRLVDRPQRQRHLNQSWPHSHSPRPPNPRSSLRLNTPCPEMATTTDLVLLSACLFRSTEDGFSGSSKTDHVSPEESGCQSGHALPELRASSMNLCSNGACWMWVRR